MEVLPLLQVQAGLHQWPPLTITNVQGLPCLPHLKSHNESTCFLPEQHPFPLPLMSTDPLTCIHLYPHLTFLTLNVFIFS